MRELRSRLKSGGTRLLWLTPMLVAIAVCYFTKECYPFSSFPMYSKFDERTYLVYLKSAEGEPLATVPTLGVYSSQVKKRYGSELNELKKKYKGSHFDWTTEQKREAGNATLNYLKETLAPDAFAGGKLDGVRLIDLRIYLKDGNLAEPEEEVGRLEANP